MVQKSRKSFRKFPYNLNIGSLLEAKDVYNTWYPVKVISMNEFKIHVHFCNWSSRYDTWYSLTSDCLRPLMLASSRNNRDSKVPLCAPRPNRKSQETTQYELGAYVMALWQNDYEYLAKVLAHRQRQGDRSEYQLRYIWDNAVEWTPINRIRKASRYEVSYVLQFCKQQTSGSGMSTSRTKNNTSPGSQIGYSLTTRSHVKTANHTQSSSTNSKDNQHSNLLKKTSLESRSETSLEQNGMVYDKAVLQFHEACRKRRELKRQTAVEANNLEILSPTRMNSTSVTDCHSPACENLASGISQFRASGRKRKSYGDSFDHNSDKMRRSSEHSAGSPCNELKLDYPSSEINNQSPKLLTGVKDQPADIKPSIQSPRTASSISTDTQQNAAITYTVDNAGSSKLRLTISRQKCHLSQQRSPVHMTSPHHQKDDTANSPNSGTTSTGRNITKTAAPVTYPCPYCSRRLRHAKLLTAHISNYHKAAVNAEVNRVELRNCETSSGKRNDQSPSLSRYTSSLDSRLNSKDDKASHHSLACHRCDTRTYVHSDEIESLLQCQSCLNWVHQACYPASFKLCDGCLLTSQRARPSRRNECHLSCWQSSPNDSPSTINSSHHRLVSDTCELLDWTHRLTPLVKTGWVLLDNNRLSNPTSTTPPVSRGRNKRRSSPHTTTLDGLSDFADIEPPVKDGIGSQVPNSVDDNDVQSNTENVENLYMELERFAPVDRMISLSTQIGPSAMGCVTSATNTSVPLSAVTSSTESSYWRVTQDGDDDDEVLVADTNDALTGFLQDLGPNVLPDLEDMDYLTPVSADFTCPRSTSLLNGQDDDLLSAIQPHGNSILDTPVKEALSVANLLNPVPVSMMSSVLQAGDNYLCPLPMANQGDEVIGKKAAFSGSTLFAAGDMLPSLSHRTESRKERTHILENSTTATYDPTSASELLAEAPVLNVMQATVPQSTGMPCSALQVALPLATSSSSVNNSVDNLPASGIDWIRTPSTTVACMIASTTCDPKSTEASKCRAGSVLSNSGSSLVEATADRVMPLFNNACSGTNRLEADEDDYLDHRLGQVLANSKANQNLNHLDQFILGPLERAITVMEAQLDCITSKLFVNDAPNNA